MMIITPDMFKDFIDKCKVEDFTSDSSGIINNDNLSDDIDEIITMIINSIKIY